MRKPTTFVVTCILVLSLSGIALADGGITQLPGFAAPPPPPDGGSSSMMTGATNSETAEGQSDGVAAELTLLTWLAESIL